MESAQTQGLNKTYCMRYYVYSADLIEGRNHGVIICKFDPAKGLRHKRSVAGSEQPSCRRKRLLSSIELNRAYGARFDRLNTWPPDIQRPQTQLNVTVTIYFKLYLIEAHFKPQYV